MSSRVFHVQEYIQSLASQKKAVQQAEALQAERSLVGVAPAGRHAITAPYTLRTIMSCLGVGLQATAPGHPPTPNNQQNA